MMMRADLRKATYESAQFTSTATLLRNPRRKRMWMGMAMMAVVVTARPNGVVLKYFRGPSS